MLCPKLHSVLLVGLLLWAPAAIAQDNVLLLSYGTHVGSTEKSFTGSPSFEITLLRRQGGQFFKLLAGAAFSLSPSAQAVIGGNGFGAQLFGAEFMGGAGIVPFDGSTISPTLFLNGLLGARAARTSQLYPGIDPMGMGLTYGAQVALGCQIKFQTFSIYAGTTYDIRRATYLIGQSGFVLDEFSFQMGIGF